MFERYSEKPRRAIFPACAEAAALGSAYIGSEHLLLGVATADRDALHHLVGNPAEIRRRLSAGRYTT